MSEYPEELVQRVAHAISGADGPPWENPTYLDQARAALDAISETHTVIERSDAIGAAKCVYFWLQATTTARAHQAVLEKLAGRLLAAARAAEGDKS